MIKDGNSYFGLEGIIEGETLDYWAQIGGGWDITKNLDEMIFNLKSENLPFELKKSWKFYQNSYRADLSYEFFSKKKITDVNLYLKLGPGINENSVEGLGISGNTYSFTELIYKTDKVLTKKLENKNDVFLLNKNDNLDWAGLHSRYFLFILKTQENFQI